MRHWIIDREAVALDNWLVAMPSATLIARADAARSVFSGSGIIWVRLRAGENPSEVLAGIHRSPEQSVVLLADVPEDRVVLDALSAGAAGCCNSRAAPLVLRRVALVVANGGSWVGESLLAQLAGATHRRLAEPVSTATDGWDGDLSGREAEVARQVASGASNKEIARRLGITERTVKAHLSAIFTKLGVRDRLQLALRVSGRAD